MHKIKKSVRIVFILTALFTLSIIVGVFIGSELSYKVTPEYQYSPISYTKNTIKDPNFIEGKQYIAGGSDGSDLTTTRNLLLGDTKITISSENRHVDPINQYTFEGNLSSESLKQHIQKQFDDFINDLKADNNLEKYNDLNIESIDYKDTTNFNFEDKFINVATVNIFMQNCNFLNSFELKYNVNIKDYEFDGMDKFKSDLCNKYVVPNEPLVASCVDCTYYPVDKKHPLDQNYSVEVVAADGIPGDQKFAKFAYANLLDMYIAAKAAGHNMRLTSAYRSYQDQQDVYEGWVQYEMSFGKSRAQAESDANTYSALPGFSEHQLGTTADISSLDCLGIETVCAANENLWLWLKDHAYEFGFVMSYPVGKDDLTGYIHEPWHYRFIGIDLAKEFKTKYENRSYLAEFLRNKKLY